MIRSVTLHNFESHRDTTIKFGLGVNMLVGESENGKSAVLRAIQWVATNRPTGDAFRSHWGGETSVTVETDECQVTRSKGTTNKYIIEMLDDTKPLVLTAFGTDVPKAVLNALNLQPINYQSQFDSHFLLPPVSPGEVARRLNELVNLDVIDRTQSNLNSNLRDNSRKLSERKILREQYSSELKDMEYLEKASSELATIEALDKKAELLRVKKKGLDTLLDKLSEMDDKLGRYVHVDDAWKAITALEDIAIQAKSIRNEYNALCSIVSRIEGIDQECEETLAKSKAAEKEFHALMGDRCILCGQEIQK